MRSRARALGALVAASAVSAVAPVAEASARTWFVDADAPAGGRGDARSPFATLAAVEAASRAGDRIVIVPARKVLDGGLALKPRQRLQGGGPSVTAPDAAARERGPRLTNTDGARLDGDAVRLADGVVVRNLEIRGPRRGGIYGLDVGRATITGNDVSGHNTSCTRGFHIPPFNVPTTAPGVGVPISDGLHNGWAGIMVDALKGAGKVTVNRNRVRDAECGDGIDVRIAGDASYRVAIGGNDVSGLRQGEAFESVLAIGLQTRERGRLVARLDDNRQRALGNDEDAGFGPSGADSEGVFVNPTGPSSMRVLITRNRYEHTPGRGGFSANGLEFVSMGDGSRALVDVRDSTFSGTPGDVLEQLALGTNARLRMRLDRVVATGSTGFGGSGFGDTVIIPGNNGDCLIGASGGAGNVVDLVVRRTTLTNCANNGLTFGSSVANGDGPTSLLRLDVAESTITGNRGGNLRVGNISTLDELLVRVQDTDLSGSRGETSTPANLTAEDLGTTARATIDLGGGALGSRGGNCLTAGRFAAAVVGYEVTARRAWWGAPGGPGPGRVVTADGALDAADPLAAPPPGRC